MSRDRSGPRAAISPVARFAFSQKFHLFSSAFLQEISHAAFGASSRSTSPRSEMSLFLQFRRLHVSKFAKLHASRLTSFVYRSEPSREFSLRHTAPLGNAAAAAIPPFFFVYFRPSIRSLTEYLPLSRGQSVRASLKPATGP